MSTRTLLSIATAACALSGCEWIAGIEDTSAGSDAALPDRDAALPDRDAAPPDRDAAVPTVCPTPCLASAVEEFAYDQGGTTGRWSYLETQPDPRGASGSEMYLATLGAAEQAWVGTSTPPPAILFCPDYPDAPQCAGMADTLSLVTTSDAPDVNHPSLLWTAPYTGTFRLSGAWRSPDDAPTGVPQTLIISRSSRLDSVLFERSSSSPAPAAFDLEIHALAGDLLALTAFANAPAGVPVGVRFHISEGQSAGLCQMATQFLEDGSGNFPDLCRTNAAFVDNAGSGITCDTSPCPATQEALPPFGGGRARRFVEGSSMEYAGGLNDYSGDWTVQFWANLDGTGVSEQWLLADFDCAQQGGLAVFHDTVDLYFELLHEDPARDYCAGTAPKLVRIPSPAPGTWHFFRMVRDRDAGTVRVCMDGEQRGTIAVPSEARMPSAVPMSLGRRDGRLAYFRGALHDLRVFQQALPCPSVP
jgi:hypothetical protein